MVYFYVTHTLCSFSGPGHVTFWTLTTSEDSCGVEIGERLRATEGRFMMTSVADVESVAATGQTRANYPAFDKKKVQGTNYHSLIYLRILLQLQRGRGYGFDGFGQTHQFLQTDS